MSTPVEADDHTLMTVTVASADTPGAELPVLRRFAAVLSDRADDAPIVGDLATCELTLISLKYGLQEAFIDADGEDGDLAAVMEELLALDREKLLDPIFPELTTVLVIDRITVPDALRGNKFGTKLVQGLADHFDFIPGSTLVVGYPVPDDADQMDPFTLRAGRARLEDLAGQLGMAIFGSTGAWFATLATLRLVAAQQQDGR